MGATGHIHGSRGGLTGFKGCGGGGEGGDRPLTRDWGGGVTGQLHGVWIEGGRQATFTGFGGGGGATGHSHGFGIEGGGQTTCMGFGGGLRQATLTEPRDKSRKGEWDERSGGGEGGKAKWRRRGGEHAGAPGVVTAPACAAA